MTRTDIEGLKTIAVFDDIAPDFKGGIVWGRHAVVQEFPKVPRRKGWRKRTGL